MKRSGHGYYAGGFEDADDREDFVNHEWVRLCRADTKQVLINKATADRLRIDANKWSPFASIGVKVEGNIYHISIRIRQRD